MAVQTLLRVLGAVVGKSAAVSLPSIPLRTGPFCFGRQAVPCVSALRKPFMPQCCLDACVSLSY
jgi:hypothetical protein